MKRKYLLLLAATIALMALLLSPAASASAQGSRQVWAYYMGFWGGPNTWDWQADVLTDYSLLGKYNSGHADIAAAHIDQAKGAGIDAFVVSWFGTGDQLTTTPVMNNLLDRAAERNFKIGAVMDIFNPAFNRNRAEIVQSLNYLIYDRANHPAYLRYEGKPVIIFAFQNRANFSAAEWLSIRNEVDPGRNTIWIAEGVDGCCIYGGAMDGMYAFNIAWADGSAARYTREQNGVVANGGWFYIPTVHPGWDEDKIAVRDGRPNPTSRRDRLGGQFLTQMWNGAMTINPNVVMVVSWNEYMEGTHIEPSVNYGWQALDTLRPLIAAWKGGGGAAAPTGTQVLESTTDLNVRDGPSGWNTKLGTIYPGTTYPVVGQQGSWVAITFNGITGWVHGGYARVFDGTASTPSPAPEPAPTPTPGGGQVLESTTDLNVRDGPSGWNNKLGTIYPGTTYPVIGQQNGWYNITYNGISGWVHGGYVNVSGGGAAATPPAAGGGQVLESTTDLNVRDGPSAWNNKLGTIYPGSTYPVVGQQNGWYSITYNGVTGWVHGGYVNISGGGAAASAAGGQKLEATTDLNVRDGPSGWNNWLATIYPGSTYPILGQQNGWYNITVNGINGWVHGGYVNVYND